MTVRSHARPSEACTGQDTHRNHYNVSRETMSTVPILDKQFFRQHILKINFPGYIHIPMVMIYPSVMK